MVIIIVTTLPSLSLSICPVYQSKLLVQSVFYHRIVTFLLSFFPVVIVRCALCLVCFNKASANFYRLTCSYQRRRIHRSRRK